MTTRARHTRWAAIALLALANQATAAERLPVTNVRPLLTRAVTHGSAQGVLTGDAARSLANTFGSRAPILIDVRRITPVSDDHCARLSVTTRQAEVRERGDVRERTLSYEVNWCRDGQFPQGTRSP